MLNLKHTHSHTKLFCTVLFWGTFFLNGISAPAFAQSQVKLTFELSPAGSFEAVAKRVLGSVTYKNNKLTPPPSIDVDLTQLDTGIALRNQHMRDKLEVKKYPYARLYQITATGSNKGSGKLLIHGVTKPFEFEYLLSDDKKKVTAEFTLKISDFGITEGLTYMKVGVEDEVKVEVELDIVPGK